MEKYVGKFNEKDLISGIDKIKINEAKDNTGLQYVNTKLIKKGSKIVAMEVWVCDSQSFKI